MSFVSRHWASGIGRFLFLSVFLFTLCFSVSLFMNPTAHAAGCNSDSTCNGQDPQAMGCPVTGTPADNYFGASLNNNDDVQDRWSGQTSTTNCQTNWPRANIYSLIDWGTTYHVWVTRESGSGESHLIVDGGYLDCYNYCWGNMVYAPNQLTQACIAYNSGYCATQPGFKNQ